MVTPQRVHLSAAEVILIIYYLAEVKVASVVILRPPPATALPFFKVAACHYVGAGVVLVALKGGRAAAWARLPRSHRVIPLPPLQVLIFGLCA